jgi:hypothetical protein
LAIVDIKRFFQKNQNSPQPVGFIAIGNSIRYYPRQRSIVVALKCFIYLSVIALASFFASPWASGQAAGDPQAATQDTGAASKGQIKACLGRADGAECLDQLFREILKTHSTIQVLELIQRFEKEDPEIVRDCHPVVHAVGRETFRLKGNIHDAFSACDQTCHSGCYHGSVERFLRGEEIYAQANRHPTQAELRQKAATACDPKLPRRLRFQCLHGLGHALLYFSRYQLVASLQVCDALPGDWSRESCYGGVFMENVFNSTPETRDLSPTDFHYPCDKLNDKYRGECYGMQTSRMVEMGLSTEETFRECAKAGAHGAQCSLSIGRDLSNQVRLGDAASAARKCELAQGDDRQACVRGVVYALIDNTWDGRYALPFCAALIQEIDQNRCWQESFQYMKYTFEKSADEIGKECGRLAALSRRCADLATQ